MSDVLEKPTQTVDFNKRVDQFVKLRDFIKQREAAQKEELKAHKETLKLLEGVLLNHLNSVGGDSVSTASGTVYKSEKKSATLADKEAFWAYVVSQGLWELIDYKANVTAVDDYVTKNNTPPPGVNFTTMHVANVRRK